MRALFCGLFFLGIRAHPGPKQQMSNTPKRQKTLLTPKSIVLARLPEDMEAMICNNIHEMQMVGVRSEIFKRLHEQCMAGVHNEISRIAEPGAKLYQLWGIWRCSLADAHPCEWWGPKGLPHERKTGGILGDCSVGWTHQDASFN